MEENISFMIDENKSTSSSKYIVRRRTVMHKSSGEEKESMEVFEESFTIPLHKFNLSLILSQSKIENVEDTVVVSRTVVRTKSDSSKSEEIDLTAESARDLDSILPMIDFTEISSIKLVERRRQIVKTKVRLCMPRGIVVMADFRGESNIRLPRQRQGWRVLRFETEGKGKLASGCLCRLHLGALIESSMLMPERKVPCRR